MMVLDPRVQAALGGTMGREDPTLERLLLECGATPDEQLAIVKATRGRPLKGKHTASTDAYAFRNIRECCALVAYHNGSPSPTALTAHHLRAYLEQRKAGPVEVPLLGMTLEQANPHNAYGIGLVLTRFRAHAQGLPGKPVVAMERPTADSRSITGLPTEDHFLQLLRAAKDWTELGLLWLLWTLILGVDALARVRDRDVTFVGPHSVPRIVLRDKNDKPVRVTFCPGGGWALRLLKKQRRAAGRDAHLLVTRDGRPYTGQTLYFKFLTITHRAKIRSKSPPYTLRISPKTLQDAHLVANLYAGMHPFIAGSILGVTEPRTVWEWYDAVLRDKDQRLANRLSGLPVDTTPRGRSVLPWCRACGREVQDGSCTRCRMPVTVTDSAQEMRRARLRHQLERILDAEGITRSTAASQATTVLTAIWGKPPA